MNDRKRERGEETRRKVKTRKREGRRRKVKERVGGEKV